MPLPRIRDRAAGPQMGLNFIREATGSSEGSGMLGLRPGLDVGISYFT